MAAILTGSELSEGSLECLVRFKGPKIAQKRNFL